MTFSHILFVLLLCVLTGSYTWGMRGTLLGGERGAMLPGAALALVLLYSGGSAPMATAFPMAASIGAAAMFFGGSQTYGETIGLTNASDAASRKHGYVGLAIKGAVWFAVFGGLLGFGLGVMAGRYALWETELFVVLLPIVRGLGIMLLNTPANPKKQDHPRFYFSESRREVWGGMVFIVLLILVFCACKGEWFPILLCLFGLVFGGVGFFLGNLFRSFADAHLSKTRISGWKAMECSFGAIGALGIGLCWCLFFGPFVSRYAYEITAHSGAWTPFPTKVYTLLAFIWLLCVALFIARYWFRHPGGKKTSRMSRIVYGAEDVLIYPIFCLLPLLFAMLGDVFFSQLFIGFGMFYLLPDKIVFGTKKKKDQTRYTTILHCVLILASAAILFAQLFFEVTFSAYAAWILWLAAYLIVTYLIRFDPIRLRSLKQKEGSFKAALQTLGTEPSWLIYAGVCVVTLIILGKPYFSL